MDPENQVTVPPEAPVAVDDAGQNLVPQARFDEIYAKQKEAERRAEELQKQILEQAQRQAEQIANLTAQSMAAVHRQQQVAPSDPYAGIRDRDPEFVKILEAREQAMSAQFAAQARQLEAKVQAAEVRVAVSAIPNAPPEVGAAAAAYMQRWASQGVPATPEDAINFAWGEYARKQHGRVANVRDITPPSTAVLTSANPSVQVSTHNTPQLPSNFNQLSPQRQEQILDQLYGDLPL